MHFNDVQRGMCFVRRGIVDAMQALHDIEGEYWRTQPAHAFGPVEHLAHVGQVSAHVARFVGDQLGHPYRGQSELSDDPAWVSGYFEEFNLANLRHAREQLTGFRNFGAFDRWMRRRCEGVYEWIGKLPEELAGQRVQDPSDPRSACDAATMLYWQIVVHAVAHHGTLIAEMRQAGHPVPLQRMFNRRQPQPATTTAP